MFSQHDRKSEKFQVHQDNMLSDHFPVDVVISGSQIVQQNTTTKKIYLKKAERAMRSNDRLHVHGGLEVDSIPF